MAFVITLPADYSPQPQYRTYAKDNTCRVNSWSSEAAGRATGRMPSQSSFTGCLGEVGGNLIQIPVRHAGCPVDGRRGQWNRTRLFNVTWSPPCSKSPMTSVISRGLCEAESLLWVLLGISQVGVVNTVSSKLLRHSEDVHKVFHGQLTTPWAGVPCQGTSTNWTEVVNRNLCCGNFYPRTGIDFWRWRAVTVNSGHDCDLSWLFPLSSP